MFPDRALKGVSGTSHWGGQMNWHEYIHTDTAVLAGKPVVRGTRLSVNFLLGLLAEGWTEQQILENYPQLSHQALRAVFAYVAEVMRDVILPKNRGHSVKLGDGCVLGGIWPKGRGLSVNGYSRQGQSCGLSLGPLAFRDLWGGS